MPSAVNPILTAPASGDAECSSCTSPAKMRDLNQNLLGDHGNGQGEGNVPPSSNSAAGSIKTMAATSSDPSAADGACSGTSSNDRTKAEAAVLDNPKMQRFHFVIKDRCYGVMINSKSAGPTCYGLYDVDYKLQHNRKHQVPRYMLARETIVSLKTPLPYRGVCRRNLMVLSKSQAGSEHRKKPHVDLTVREFSFQSHADVLRTFAHQPEGFQAHGVSPRTRSNNDDERSKLSSIWNVSVRLARTSRAVVEETLTKYLRDDTFRRTAPVLNQPHETAWQSAKRKWKRWMEK